MELNDTLLIIATIAIFANGCSIRRKYMPGILASALVAQAQLLITIISEGVSEYGQHLVRSVAQDWMVAMFYVAFFWGIGYICGGIRLRWKSSKSPDDLQGNDSEYVGFNLD